MRALVHPTARVHNQRNEQPRLDVEKMTRQTSRVIFSKLPMLGTTRLCIDWTIEDTQHLLVASLCTGTRAIPVYWRAYKQDSLKGRRSTYERDFVNTPVGEVLAPIARSRLMIRTDERNHLLGTVGDRINAMLSGCAWNLNKLMRALVERASLASV